MPSNTISIRSSSHKTLKEIVASTGRSVQEELDRAIEQRRRAMYLEGLRSDYEALSQDQKSMSELQKEIALWDSAAGDGLETA